MARRKPCLAASRSRSSPNGTGRISPVSPSSPKQTVSCATRPVAQARQHREHRRQVGRGLADAHAADHVHEHVLARGRDPAVPVQHREQQREAVRLESHRDAPRRQALGLVHQRLHLDQQRTAALARDRDHAARHGVVVPREEDRGGVARLPSGPAPPSRTRRSRWPRRSGSSPPAPRGSGCRDRSRNRARCRPCARARAGPAIRPSLVTWPMIRTGGARSPSRAARGARPSRAPARPSPATTPTGRCAWSGSSRRPARSTRVATASSRIASTRVSAISRSAAGAEPEPARAHRDLPHRFLAGRVQHRTLAARARPTPAAAAWTCRCPDRRRAGSRNRPPGHRPARGRVRRCPTPPAAPCPGQPRRPGGSRTPRAAGRARVPDAGAVTRPLQGVPGLAGGTLALPLRRPGAAGAAHVAGLGSGHRSIAPSRSAAGPRC